MPLPHRDSGPETSVLHNDAITIMFVDDNNDVAEMFALAANQQPDLNVVCILNDGNAVLDEVRQRHPRVLVIDLTMPGTNPLEIIKTLRQTHPDVRSIVYSGYDDPATRDLAIEAGAKGFVSKHHDLGSIFDTIRKVARDETEK
jgi:DNA-binding NarL/FixJ family response regulator